MQRFSALLALAAFAVAPVAALAADSTPAPMTGAETAFVARIQRELPKRYPTTAAAIKAGYYRFNNEDSSGAISYVDRVWTSPDPEHPSQLWYDVKGRLIGADYSVRVAESPNAPALFGMQPSRFEKIEHHVHYGIKQPDGSVKYGLGIGADKFASFGGDSNKPDAATLVKAGRATSADQVAFVFSYDEIWDASVWVLPNPAGAFAEKNPNVIPSMDRTKNSTEGH